MFFVFWIVTELVCAFGGVYRVLFPLLLLQLRWAAANGEWVSEGIRWSAVNGSCVRFPCPHIQQCVAVSRTCLARLA